MASTDDFFAMLREPWESDASREYDGPNEIRPFAEFLPFIGEFVISFARVERRVTWATESLLRMERDDADELEAYIISFSSKIKFLEAISKPIAEDTDTNVDRDNIIKDLRNANLFRNRLIHNSFTGTKTIFRGKTPKEVSIMKNKYHKNQAKRGYHIPIGILRERTVQNISLCNAIQKWILNVCPAAENRVP